MNKIFNKIAIASLSFAMSVGIGVAVVKGNSKDSVRANAAASTESVDFSAQGYSNQQAISSYNGTNFTVTFDKGSNSNAPKYYTSGTAIRCYGGNTFTVTSSSDISEIALTFGTGGDSNTISTDVGTYAEPVWSGTAQSITFTIGGSSGNRRIKAIDVTFGGGSSYTTVDDTLTRADTGISGTVYNSWTHTSSTSGAVYKGQSAGDKDSIQLRYSNSNSGIVSSVSGGYIKAVTVAWHADNTTGRTLNVYGSNDAYTDPTDLYDSSKRGTLLGTIVKDTSTSLTVSGSYKYIGIRSYNYTQYFTSITFTWNTPDTHSVTYLGNGATEGDVPVDTTKYETNDSVTVLGNTGNLANHGYYFNGWNTAADGSGTARAAGSTFSITGNTILYAQWALDTLTSISVSGSMTTTTYNVGDAWKPAGLKVTGTFANSTSDVTDLVTWSYNAYTTSTSVTSVICTAALKWEGVTKTASSSAQSVTVSDLSSPYELVPGTNGFTTSAQAEAITWVNEANTFDAYLGPVAFELEGTDYNSHTGKYYASNHSWRIYYSEGGGVKIYVDASKYKISSITFTFTAGSSNNVSGTLVDESGATLTSGTAWTPSKTTWKHVFSVATAANIQFTKISVAVESNNTQPAVEINNPVEGIDVNTSGQFTASVYNVSATVTWSTSDATIVSIDSQGNYSGLTYGTATITASITVSNVTYTDTMSVSVNGATVTIAQANAVAASMGSSGHHHTHYTVIISGYVTTLESSSSSKASSNLDSIIISDGKIGSSSNSIKVYGIYSSNPIRNYAVLNSEVTYVGKICNYNGTAEITEPTLSEYTDDAIDYAKASYEALTSTCEASGPEGITSAQWSQLATNWSSVDSYSKVKLQNAGASYQYSDDIANWITRYTTIVENRTDLEDFMQLGITRKASNNSMFALSSETSTSVIVIISVVSLTAIGGYFFIRKRRMINK